MENTRIREKLHNFIEAIEDKKTKAIYKLFEDEIEQGELVYTDTFKKELDSRYDYYKSGGQMVTAEAVLSEISELIRPEKNK